MRWLHIVCLKQPDIQFDGGIVEGVGLESAVYYGGPPTRTAGEASSGCEHSEALAASIRAANRNRDRSNVMAMLESRRSQLMDAHAKAKL
jgi:hypothetical protein